MIVIQRKKCKECKTSNYAKYNKEIVLKHLKGEVSLGLYPIKDNERVKLIALDFDEKDYKKEVLKRPLIYKLLNYPEYDDYQNKEAQ